MKLEAPPHFNEKHPRVREWLIDIWRWVQLMRYPLEDWIDIWWQGVRGAQALGWIWWCRRLTRDVLCPRQAVRHSPRWTKEARHGSPKNEITKWSTVQQLNFQRCSFTNYIPIVTPKTLPPTGRSTRREHTSQQDVNLHLLCGVSFVTLLLLHWKA